MTAAKRLVAVVEGHGEVEAVKKLLARVLAKWPERGPWAFETARVKRHRLVSQTGAFDVTAVVALAKSERADTMLVLLDADDDCPKECGPRMNSQLEQAWPGRAAAVLIYREFETWLALSKEPTADQWAAIEAKRNAKSLMERYFGTKNYKPTQHQAGLVAQVDIDGLKTRSKSFNKLVRELERVTRPEP